MGPTVSLVRGLVVIAALAMANSSAANNPVKKTDRDLSIDHAYVLIKEGPNSKVQSIYLTRMDVETGQVIWQYGQGSPSKRTNMDVAVLNSKGWRTSSDGTTYLLKVNPGYWVIGGVDDAYDRTSFAMGSYGFEAKAGQITYVGSITAGRENGRSKDPRLAKISLSSDLVNYGALINIVMSTSFVLDKPQQIDELPHDLPQFPVVVAQINDDVRFNNFTLGLVSRAADLPPIRAPHP